MKPFNTKVILIIIISAAVGLLAGFLGCFLFLISGRINIPLAGNLQKYFPQKEITIQTQEKITVERDVLIKESTQEIKNGIVRIFLAKKPLSPEELKNKDILSQAYSRNDILGSGFFLTADGWIVSTEAAVSNPQKNYLILTENDKFYPVEKIIKDSFTGVVFLKISASNMPVMKLDDKENISLGEEISIFDKDKNISVAFLKQLEYCPDANRENLIRNTEKFCGFILTDKNFDENFYGSALISLDKSLIGIIGKDKQIIPSYYFKNLVNQILKNGAIDRPYLGIDFVDLSSLVLSEADRIYFTKMSENKGILISKIAKNSSAAKAGLLKGDIILKIDKETINHKIGFSELLQNYISGDTLELTILRLGKEEVVKLKL